MAPKAMFERINKFSVDGSFKYKNVGCRRRTGRRLQEFLYCNLGQVLDLSLGGMRVLGREAVEAGDEDTVDVSFKSAVGDLTVPATVAWTKRTGLGRWESGLEFPELSEEARRQLTRISTAHRYEHPDVA